MKTISLAATTILVLSLTACGTESAQDVPQRGDAAGAPTGAADPESSTDSDSPTPSDASTPAEPPQFINYADDDGLGIVVHGPMDADQLTGAPDAFETFIGRMAAKIVDNAPCDDAAVGVGVKNLRTDGFASGSVNECGGYVALWADVDGGWREIEGTQDLWSCEVLERYEVPSEVAGDSCYDDEANEQVPYVQA